MALNKENNFLQSDIWRQFQEAVGHKTFTIKEGSFSANIMEHELLIVGKYFYIPRGPVCHLERSVAESKDLIGLDFSTPLGMTKIVDLAKKNNAGWIRIEPENEEILNLIRKNIELKIKKAPHEMQPGEILIMDIGKSEEELLAQMKSKTRYNINLAQKRGVLVRTISNDQFPISNQVQNLNDKNKEYYVNKFIKLVNLTAKRKGVEFHPGNYYRKMLEVIPDDILKLYVAEYNNKVIAANLMIFYADTATYLHGATDDEYRNVMAPYLLQWQAILDAKKAGCKFYDFGGIKTKVQSSKFKVQNFGDWSGITKFKVGFSPGTEPIKFPGSFDLVIKLPQYLLYRFLSQVRKYF